MKIIRLQNKKGFTLLEMVFYVALFSVISLILVQAIITMVASFRETQITADINQTNQVLERVSREIRQATSISTITATNLKLNTTDSSGNAATITFTLSGTNIELRQNDVLIGNLNSTNLKITALTFTQITTSNSSAVKIEMTATSNRYGSVRAANFYDTLVLRGSY
ncbi:MAG: prepilin-type N-terminal cleavage/methylation domain-containing protein [Candidatus Pacebacteria bacterium]|nr:prepilin-type N-terminal cleavage/methylation domain-containing protein [Candidatus Paceibacterota bacterium]